jgi:hemerythrin-like domain-containing protein
MADIYTTLRHDHEELKKALMDVSAGDRDGLTCASAELQAHWEAEEAVLYAALEGDPQAAALVSQAKKEHMEARSMTLGLVLDMNKEQEFPLKIQTLRNTVAQHIQQEEDMLFEQARRVLTAEQAEAMSEEFSRQRQQVKGRLRASRPY